MKKILLFVFLLSMVAYGTQVSTNKITGTTWVTSDTSIANGNYSFDSSASIGAFYLPSGQTYTLSKTSDKYLTLNNNGLVWKDSSTGTKTYPDSIAFLGNSRAAISSLSGTITATGTSLYFGGTSDTLHDHKGVTFKALYIGSGTTMVNAGALASTFSTAGTPLNFISGGALTVNKQITLTRTTAGDMWAINGNPTITGSDLIYSNSNSSGNINIPAITTSTQLRISSQYSVSEHTITLTGNISTGAFNIRWATGSITANFTTGNYNISANGAFTLGPAVAAGTFKTKLGSSVITCTSWDGSTNNGAAGEIDSLQSATITNTGNWSWGSNHTVVPGTSVVLMQPATGVTATITSANKSFYTFKVMGAAGTTAKVLLADSLTVLGNLIDSTGKFFTAGNNINLAGDFYRYSTDSVSMSTTRFTTTKANALYYRRAAIRDNSMRGVTLAATNGINFDVDSNMTFYRMYMGTGKKMQLTAGKTFKDSTYTAADLDNDTIVSTVAGSKVYFNAPANTAISNTYFKDVYAVNMLYDTASNGGYNGGNDSNIVFKDANGAKYLSANTVLGLQETRPATGSTSGGYADTLIGFGFYAPCSLFVNNSYIASTVLDSNRITFTMPSVSAGAVTFQVKNIDGAQADTTTRNMSLLATATDSANQGASYVASKANDNNTATYWWSNNGVSWLKIDLGHDKYVDSSNLYMQFSSSWKYKIEYATDSAPTTWNMYVDKTGNTVTDTQYTNINLSKKGRYWRFTQTNAALWAAVREWRLYGKRTKTFALFTATGGGGCISSISYADSPVSDTINKSKTHAVTLGGCAPDSFVVIGTALPSGFSINKTSGLISYNGGGSPQGATNYTIRAYGTNKTDSASATVSLAIIINAPVISYTDAIDTTGKAASHAVTSTGGAVDSFIITSGSLPAGLSLTKASGLISGTPTTVTAASDIVITAYNNGGTDTGKINLAVVGCLKSISYASSPKICTTSVSTSQAVTLGGCTPDSFNFATLPAGLTGNKTSGLISGTPTAKSSKTGYRVVAYGSLKSDSAVTYDSITVVGCLELRGISYANSPIIGNVNTPFYQSITLNGCTPDSFNFATLPAGLTGNKATGEITGTPSDTVSKAGYRIVAYGAAKTDSAFCFDTITIIPQDTTSRRKKSKNLFNGFNFGYFPGWK